MASIESPVDELIFGRKFLDACNHVVRLSGSSAAPNRREYVAHHGEVGPRLCLQDTSGSVRRRGRRTLAQADDTSQSTGVPVSRVAARAMYWENGLLGA